MPDDYKNSLDPLLPNLNFKVRRGDSLVQRIGTRETVVEYPLSFDDFLFCEQVAREVGVHFQALDSQRMYTPNQDISYYTVADSHLSRCNF